MGSRGRAATWLALFATGGLPAQARAGNDDGILVGGQAAISAGAVTATVSDGSAAWYNPAGLARSDRQTLDINASAYGISLVTADDLFTVPDGTTSDASFTDWQLVPTALSYTRQLGPRLVGAFGVMIPTTTDSDLRTALTQMDGTRWTLAVDEIRNEYDYIASLAMRVSERLRLGLSVHGIYISDEQMVQVAIGQPGDPARPFQSTSLHETRGDYGARLGLGVQWSVTGTLELGLALQTPTLTGFRLTRRTQASGAFLGTDQGGDFSSSHEDGLKSVWDVSTPFVVRAGLAYAVGKAQLLLDGSVMSPLDRAGEDDDRKLAGNLRVASLVPLSDTLTFGVGVFSDMNGLEQAGANYLGLAGGMRFSSHYVLTDGARPLTFATTLAGRYAFGWGHTRGLLFNADGSSTLTDATLRVHELALNLGGAVSF